MNIEQIEHELTNRKGALVTVVRPGYGTQSDSWDGRLMLSGNEFPIIFQVVSQESATIFGSDDIADVELRPAVGMIRQEEQIIIRLKGPYDYKEHFVKA